LWHTHTHTPSAQTTELGTCATGEPLIAGYLRRQGTNGAARWGKTLWWAIESVGGTQVITVFTRLPSD
jgi:hypothetical protein